MTGIEKLSTFGNKNILSVARNSGKNSSFNTNPLKQLHNDTISFTSKGKYEYINENDTSLFEDCNLHPLKSFNDLSFDNIVLVHKTDYFPENGIIKTLKNSVRDSEGNVEARSTLHFSLNNPVKSHELASWDDKKYVILTPLTSAIQNQENDTFLGGMPRDFVFSGNLKLPKDSVIVKYNEEIANGKLRISKDKTTGLKLVESSNKNLSSVSQNIIKKMGFVCFKDLVKENNVSNEEIMNGWEKFCEENGYIVSHALYIPHHRADHLFTALCCLSGLDSWYNEDMYGDMVDYKEELIKIIDEIKEMAPKNKPLSYDIDKFKDIIKQAENPSEAYKNVKKQFHIASVKIAPIINKEFILQKLKEDKLKQFEESKKSLPADILPYAEESFNEFLNDEETLDSMYRDALVSNFEFWAGKSKDRFIKGIDDSVPDILDEYID